MNKKAESSKRMARSAARKGTASASSAVSLSFRPGAIVLATLRDPREKFWGALLALDPAGVSLQGLELSSFEDATSAVIAGEPLPTAVLFFPMHRVERIELDLPEGALPSLSQRFQARTGMDARAALTRTVQHGAARKAGA